MRRGESLYVSGAGVISPLILELVARISRVVSQFSASLICSATGRNDGWCAIRSETGDYRCRCQNRWFGNKSWSMWFGASHRHEKQPKSLVVSSTRWLKLEVCGISDSSTAVVRTFSPQALSIAPIENVRKFQTFGCAVIRIMAPLEWTACTDLC